MSKTKDDWYGSTLPLYFNSCFCFLSDARTYSRPTSGFQRNDFSYHKGDASSLENTISKGAQNNGHGMTWNSYTSAFHSWLKKQVDKTTSGCSLKNILAGDVTFDTGAAESVTCPAPPPLLHLPSKRSREQSHSVKISQELNKRPRRQPHHSNFEESPAVFLRRSNDGKNLRELMFEKTRSLGKALKQLGPPPPLLKGDQEGQINNHPLTIDSTVKWNNSGIENGVTNSTSHCNQSKNLQSPAQKQCSPRNVGEKSSKLENGDPVPRQIDSSDPTSCGGYAFDHMAMPKIIAVHSISKSPDVDECTNKQQSHVSDKTTMNDTASDRECLDRSALENAEPSNSQSRSPIAQNHKQPHVEVNSHGKWEQIPGSFAHCQTSSCENISFERYLLFYLLHRFQGNVELVKQVLTQNMIQEWLAYCHGNADLAKQKICGVDFHELRKLYERRSRLQSAPFTNDSSPQGILRTQADDCTVGSLCTQSNANEISSRNGYSVQNDLNHHRLKAMHFEIQKQWSQNNASEAKQKAIHAALSGLHLPTCEQQRVQNEVGVDTNDGDCRRFVQNKIGIASENSVNSSDQCERSDVTEFLCKQRGVSNAQFSMIYQQISAKQTCCSVSKLHFPSRSHKGACQEFSVIQNTSHGPGKNDHIHHENHAPIQNKGFERVQPFNLPNVVNHVPVKRNVSGLSFLTSEQFHRLQLNANTQSSTVTPPVEGSQEASFTNLTIKSKDLQSEGLANSLKPRGNNLGNTESREKDVLINEEPTGNYQWRYKDGKLISGNLSSFIDVKNVTEIKLSSIVGSQQNHVNGTSLNEAEARIDVTSKRRHSNGFVPITVSTDKPHSGSITCQSNMSTVENEAHKKVCGAAAAGQRCYCKGELKNSDKTSNPIRSIQQMVKLAAGNGSAVAPNTPQGERAKTKEQSCANAPLSQASAHRDSVGPPLKTSLQALQPPSSRAVKMEAKVEAGNKVKKKTNNGNTMEVPREESANAKQSKTPLSPAKRKQYSTVQELGNKIVETRERLERETIPWKKKILKSLEAVLTKRLRKLERETGEEAGIEIFEENETSGAKNASKEAKRGDKSENKKERTDRGENQ